MENNLHIVFQVDRAIVSTEKRAQISVEKME